MAETQYPSKIITSLKSVLLGAGIKYVSTSAELEVDLTPYDVKLPAAVITWQTSNHDNSRQCRYARMKTYIAIRLYGKTERAENPQTKILELRNAVELAIKRNQTLINEGKSSCISCLPHRSDEPTLSHTPGAISYTDIILQALWEQKRFL